MSSRTSYLDLVKAVDNFPLDIEPRDLYYELYLPYDNSPHGYILPETVQKMPWTANFEVKHEHTRAVTVLDSSKGEDTGAAVTAAFTELINACIEQDLFHVLDRKHSEPYTILGANYAVQVERFATSLFGITSCGAVMVAYVNNNDGINLWIPRRAAHLYSSPGLLDCSVAGGVKAGHSPLETIIEEAAEEASLPEALMRERVRARGVITSMWLTADDWPGEKGLVVPGIMYVYDIELPEDVVPAPHDEEVNSFQLMSIKDAQAAMLSNEFKSDSAVVLIDFMIRHGIVSSDNEKDYAEIVMHLHRQLPFRISPARSNRQA